MTFETFPKIARAFKEQKGKKKMSVATCHDLSKLPSLDYQAIQTLSPLSPFFEIPFNFCTHGH